MEFVFFSLLDCLLVSPVLALVLWLLLVTSIVLGDRNLSSSWQVVLRWVPGRGVRDWAWAMGTIGLGRARLGQGGDRPAYKDRGWGGGREPGLVSKINI